MTSSAARPKAARSQSAPPSCLSSKGSESWAIVLAGGSGERMKPFVRSWLGEDRPKQYCRFVGRQSMLEHTLNRASRLVRSDQILTLVAREHVPFLADLCPLKGGTVLAQPKNCGTAAGVLFPAAVVLARNPEATIHILPSDHFISPEGRFHQHLKGVEALLASYPSRMILTAAQPTRAEREFGWIEPSERVLGTADGTLLASEVASFREKPNQTLAEHFMAEGHLWNTMIVSVKAKTLWRLAHEFVPRLARPLSRISEVVAEGATLDAVAREAALVYHQLESFDFSSDLVQPAETRCLVSVLEAVEWSDWGRPERILQSVERLGLQANFKRSAPRDLVLGVEGGSARRSLVASSSMHLRP